MTIPRAITLLSQMYLPQFDDEEKEAITMAINALNKQDWEENQEITLVENHNVPCKFGAFECANKYKFCIFCRDGSCYMRKDDLLNER